MSLDMVNLDRLAVRAASAAGGAVSHMTDRDVSVSELCERIMVKNLVDKPYVLV